MRRTLEFDAVAIEGGLLPPEWLAKIASLEAPHQSAGDYGVPRGLNLRDELGRYWRIAEAHWSDFAAGRSRTDDLHALTTRFVLNLCRDVFGAGDALALDTARVIGDRHYPVTASMRQDRLPLVIAPSDQRLDERDRRHGDHSRQRSAFGLLQEFLNASDAALWGVASNGLQLRLARDNASLTRPAWIEVDVERIFKEERFADFSLLWLLVHASRFGNSDAMPEQCPLEAWRHASKEEGTRAREQLSERVESALLALGNGFLAEPANETLRASLATGALTPSACFQQLLRMVYRLIFLLTIEERGLLHPTDSDPERMQIYASGYSLRRLRERARLRRAADRNTDLWEGLRPVFDGLARGQPLLALPPLGGLFGPDQCPDLDRAALPNGALLQAMFMLGWMRSRDSICRINWRDTGPEELGSVYESLLELVPVISADGRCLEFAGAAQSRGNARKTSGSYYTPDPLVQELLDSALEPIIRQRLAGAVDAQAALLAITVCDPACGSGHFLLGAARRLATHLAQVRANGTPSGDDFRHALRDVITHCIHGVDRNPMALELARMSLWLEAMTPDRPLGFIDHHLQCGDALLGVTDLGSLVLGIPQIAYKPLSGDDKDICKALAKANAIALKDLHRKRVASRFGQGELLTSERDWTAEFRRLEQMSDASLDTVVAKRDAWEHLACHATQRSAWRAADLMLAAFLMPRIGPQAALVPTTATLLLDALGDRDQPGHAEMCAAAQTACRDAKVFHWPLAFPLVTAAGGFDCVLGNPPWERIKLQEEEFFASRSRDVAEATTKVERSRRIQRLSEGSLAGHLSPTVDREEIVCESERRLYREFISARRTAEAASLFAHVDSDDGGRYPLTGVGDVNTYALFAETIGQISSDAGRAGFIVPTGIATDDGTKAYFADLVARQRLVSIRSFENEEFIFPDVHHAFRFCLLTLGPQVQADFVFFARNVAHARDPRRRFTLTASDFALLNPNTLTCPVFRSERDAELTKKLYGTAPVLVDETRPDGNPWGVRLMTMLHMSNDSDLFFEVARPGALPLYEAKMIHQFDHRWATFTPDGSSRDVLSEEKADPNYSVLPRYWVDEREVAERLAAKLWRRGWLVGWRDITGVEKIRTVIASVIPKAAVGNQMPLILFESDPDPKKVAALLANLCSLTFDFVARHKTGGTHLNFFIVKQLPVLPPVRFDDAVLAFIVPRVLELTYTAEDLRDWARDLGCSTDPFKWDDARRALLRAELDAYFARLYGLTRDELRYVLDPGDVMGADFPSKTFNVLRDRELREHGEYRTRRLVLDAWDRLQSGALN